MTSNQGTPSVSKENVLDLLQHEEPDSWIDLSGDKVYIPLVIAGLILLLWLNRKIRRAIRRRRPPKIHPLLQKYGAASMPEPAELKEKRRAEAKKILATSSGATIAGHDVIEHVEAVFVDQLKRPEDALEALKAASAMKGANAVIQVHQQRGDNGTYSASGDAVIVRRRDVPDVDEDDSASDSS